MHYDTVLLFFFKKKKASVVITSAGSIHKIKTKQFKNCLYFMIRHGC